MKIEIPYIPPNWNDYINAERTNKYIANKIKQDEKRIMMYLCSGTKYEGNYPVEISFKPHYLAYRQDLDNFRYKGILDGLVTAGVLKNDNLKCIKKISLEAVVDGESYIDIEIKPYEE